MREREKNIVKIVYFIKMIVLNCEDLKKYFKLYSIIIVKWVKNMIIKKLIFLKFIYIKFNCIKVLKCKDFKILWECIV